MNYQSILSELSGNNDVSITIMEYVDLITDDNFTKDLTSGKIKMIWKDGNTKCFQHENGRIIYLVK